MNEFFSRHRFLLIGLVLALLGTCVLYFCFSSQPPASGEKVAASPPLSSPTPPAPSRGPITNPSPRQLTISSSEDEEDVTITVPSDRPRFVSAGPPQRRTGENDVDLRKASVSVRAYRQAFKQNPVGNNAQITRALSGKNPRNTRYLPADAHLSDKGELIDHWDQPLFFHQISATVMEVRSAGPDHVMWTADDEALP